MLPVIQDDAVAIRMRVAPVGAASNLDRVARRDASLRVAQRDRVPTDIRDRCKETDGTRMRLILNRLTSTTHGVRLDTVMVFEVAELTLKVLL